MMRTPIDRLSSVIWAEITSLALTLRRTELGSKLERLSSIRLTLQYKSRPEDSTGLKPTFIASSELTLPSTELVVVADNPKRIDCLFIYHRDFLNRPMPQIIYDMEMFEYQVEHGKIPVLQ